MDLTGGEDLSIGSEISFAFGGNAVHVFNKETGENLEFWFAEDCVLDGEKNRIYFSSLSLSNEFPEVASKQTSRR